jgi:hypothetical protein
VRPSSLPRTSTLWTVVDATVIAGSVSSALDADGKTEGSSSTTGSPVSTIPQPVALPTLTWTGVRFVMWLNAWTSDVATGAGAVADEDDLEEQPRARRKGRARRLAPARGSGKRVTSVQVMGSELSFTSGV